MYVGPSCNGYALNCLLGNTEDTSVMHEKAKFVCFIHMQPQKVKFKFVQINMKQVLYSCQAHLMLFVLRPKEIL